MVQKILHSFNLKLKILPTHFPYFFIYEHTERDPMQVVCKEFIGKRARRGRSCAGLLLLFQAYLEMMTHS